MINSIVYENCEEKKLMFLFVCKAFFLGRLEN